LTQNYQQLVKLIENAMNSVTFEQAVMEAKYETPQSFIFHSLSVATLAYDICEAIKETSPDSLKRLSELYKGITPEELCFYGGFLHDWNKLKSLQIDKSDEEEKLKIAKEETMKIAKELLKYIKEDERLIDDIVNTFASYAEGSLNDRSYMPAWVAIKLADMLMISNIQSIKDIPYFMESESYENAIKTLNSYKLKLDYISSSFRLFTLIASRNIIDDLIEKGYRPLMSYKDGVVFLRPEDKPFLKLSDIYRRLREEVSFGGSIDNKNDLIDDRFEKIKRCLNRDIINEINNNKEKAIQYDLNAILLTRICKPFEDVVGSLDNSIKLEVAKKVINELQPIGVIMYFIHRFSSKDEDYIAKKLGFSSKPTSRQYILKIDDTNSWLKKILMALQERYSSNSEDLTLKYYTKYSFSGDIKDDLTWNNDTPKDYCTVCGLPIYSTPTRFVQYAEEIRGKAEIWIPREKALDYIDTTIKLWSACPICIYEARQMRDIITPPYLIISFYPGIPISLLDVLDFNKPEPETSRIDVNEKFYNVFKMFGGDLTTTPSHRKLMVGYLGSKIIISIVSLGLSKQSKETRITKTSLNKMLHYAPFLSIIFLIAPVRISSEIYDVPLYGSNVISVSSNYSYSFLKPENISNDSRKPGGNLKVIYQLLAYSAKYEALTNVTGKMDLDNMLNKLVQEWDLYASVDPALGVLSLGLGLGTPISFNEGSFFWNISRRAWIILDAMGKVSGMGDSLKDNIFSLAFVLKEVVGEVPSKYAVIGFIRDGVDTFFRTSFALENKDDRVELATNAALGSLENKYSLDQKNINKAYYALKSIFETLYDIEKKSDRGLAMSVANTITNWIYIALSIVKPEGEKN